MSIYASNSIVQLSCYEWAEKRSAGSGMGRMGFSRKPTVPTQAGLQGG